MASAPELQLSNEKALVDLPDTAPKVDTKEKAEQHEEVEKMEKTEDKEPKVAKEGEEEEAGRGLLTFSSLRRDTEEYSQWTRPRPTHRRPRRPRPRRVKLVCFSSLLPSAHCTKANGTAREEEVKEVKEEKEEVAKEGALIKSTHQTLTFIQVSKRAGSDVEEPATIKKPRVVGENSTGNAE